LGWGTGDDFQWRFFSFVVANNKKLSYLCSPMRYLIKPSDKIVCWESTDSTTLNSLLPYIDGQSVGRLFFAETTN
jgi:hypothetical protein